MPVASRRCYRNGQVASDQIGVSRAKPLRGAESALDTPICSGKRVAVAIDGLISTPFRRQSCSNTLPLVRAKAEIRIS